MQLDNALVSTQWLEQHLDDPSLRIFDTTIYLQPKPGEDPTILAGMLRILIDEKLYFERGPGEDL